MQTLAEIKAILEQHGLSPRHALGQNFLIERTLIAKLLDAAGAKAGDVVLEVGPGTGTLTEALLERGCRVIACELDRGLAEVLRHRLGSNPTFTLIEGDCLATGKKLNADIAQALAGVAAFKLIANLPYQAATPLILNLLIDHAACGVLAVTIQKEVAERLAAKPGGKDYGTLAVVAQAAAEIAPVAKLPPECFWPRPEITSAMVLLTRRAEPLTNELGKLASFAQGLFSKRRKQLGAILGRTKAFPEGIGADLRPESLSPADFVRLMHSHGE